MATVPHDPRSDRRPRLEQAASHHDDLPDSSVETQADKARDLLGDEGEMIVTAIDALNKNLNSAADAPGAGPQLIQTPDDQHRPDPPPEEPG